MIGQLINKFEASEDNTVRAFNELFKESLEYPSDSIVGIGEMLVGGLRELTIDNKVITMNLYNKDLTRVK